MFTRSSVISSFMCIYSGFLWIEAQMQSFICTKLISTTCDVSCSNKISPRFWKFVFEALHALASYVSFWAFWEFGVLLQFMTILVSPLTLLARQDGAGRDPDARWLLRWWHVGAEDACYWPQQGCVAEGDRGNPCWRSDAQARGETWYASEIDR